MQTKYRTLAYTTAGTAAALALGLCLYGFARPPERSESQTLSTLSTPPGITLQALGRGQGWDLGKETASVVYRDEVAYADHRGHTLYTYEKDEPGKSRCVNECAQKFVPVEPLEDASPVGDWSIIERDDGRRQWAYLDRPLYTYVEDADPGSLFGNSAARFGARRKDGFGNIVGGGRRGSGVRASQEDKPAPPGWQPALFYSKRMQRDVPTGIGVAEVLDAAALTLIDYRGHTAYVFAGSAAEEEKATASGQWVPVVAPALAVSKGDFSTVARKDGRTQWRYKGKPLYTYREDLKPGDAYGTGQGWQVAAIHRHFVPENVTVQRTSSQGLVWATAEGKTLYKRDGHIYQSGGGRSLHRGAPQRPAVGRDIGVNAQCEGKCAELWTPFLAPQDAKPQGYWDVYTRADGTKQWAYQGYALWTYAEDERPGDMLGHDTYDMYFAMDARTRIDIGTPMDGIATLIWAVAFP